MIPLSSITTPARLPATLEGSYEHLPTAAWESLEDPAPALGESNREEEDVTPLLGLGHLVEVDKYALACLLLQHLSRSATPSNIIITSTQASGQYIQRWILRVRCLPLPYVPLARMKAVSCRSLI